MVALRRLLPPPAAGGGARALPTAPAHGRPRAPSRPSRRQRAAGRAAPRRAARLLLPCRAAAEGPGLLPRQGRCSQGAPGAARRAARPGRRCLKGRGGPRGSPGLREWGRERPGRGAPAPPQRADGGGSSPAGLLPLLGGACRPAGHPPTFCSSAEAGSGLSADMAPRQQDGGERAGEGGATATPPRSAGLLPPPPAQDGGRSHDGAPAGPDFLRALPPPAAPARAAREPLPSPPLRRHVRCRARWEVQSGGRWAWPHGAGNRSRPRPEGPSRPHGAGNRSRPL